MKQFAQRELHTAYAHAAMGGQALHVCESRQFVTSAAPKCFQRSPQFAHLLDQDEARLRRTARALGVRVIKVGRRGERGQHIDLCGKPLERALALCVAAPAAACPECHEPSTLPELFDAAVMRGMVQCPRCEIGSPAAEWRGA